MSERQLTVLRVSATRTNVSALDPTDTPGPDAEAEKHHRILAAAVQVLARYGFRRTSMEDIALAAGMSRPALFQHFRNKEDILRSLLQAYYDTCATDLQAALADGGPVGRVLPLAFAAVSGPMVATLLESPHGPELLDSSLALAADIKEAGEARLAMALSGWLAAQAQAGQVRLPGPADDTAALMMRALKGIKQPPYADYAANRDRLAELMARGLAP